MPEYPDVVTYIDALRKRIVGRELREFRLLNPFVLRTVEPRPSEFVDTEDDSRHGG